MSSWPRVKMLEPGWTVVMTPLNQASTHHRASIGSTVFKGVKVWQMLIIFLIMGKGCGLQIKKETPGHLFRQQETSSTLLLKQCLPRLCNCPTVSPCVLRTIAIYVIQRWEQPCGFFDSFPDSSGEIDWATLGNILTARILGEVRTQYTYSSMESLGASLVALFPWLYCVWMFQ